MSYFITFNGQTNEDHGLMIYTRPKITPAAENINTYDLPGRERNLVDRSGNYNSEKIEIKLGYGADPAKWPAQHRAAILWLRGSGNLSFSDDAEWFYKVLYVSLGSNERSEKKMSSITATFYCRPGLYLVEGWNYQSLPETLDNPYSTCRPVYLITGDGSFTLTVNGNSMTAVVSRQLYVDTDLKIAYASEDAITNTAVSGDYDDLVLVPGENTLSFTGSGTVQIQPNFRVM